MINTGTSQYPEKLYVYEAEAELSFDSPSFLGLWPEGGLFYLFFTEPEDDLVARAAPGGRGGRIEIPRAGTMVYLGFADLSISMILPLAM